MREMRRQGQGFNLDENYIRKLRGQARVSSLQGKGEVKVIKTVMNLKIEDQGQELKRL